MLRTQNPLKSCFISRDKKIDVIGYEQFYYDEQRDMFYFKHNKDRIYLHEILTGINDDGNKRLIFKNGHRNDYTNDNIEMMDVNYSDDVLPKGITYYKSDNRYRVGITVNYKFINMGKYRSLEDAIVIRNFIYYVRDSLHKDKLKDYYEKLRMILKSSKDVSKTIKNQRMEFDNIYIK